MWRIFQFTRCWRQMPVLRGVNMEAKRIDGKLELSFDGRYAYTCNEDDEKLLRKVLCPALKGKN